MRNQIPKERHPSLKEWQNSNPSLIPRPPRSPVPNNTGLKWATGLSPQHQLLTDRQGVSTTHFPYRSPRRFNNTFPNVSRTLTSPSPGFAPLRHYWANTLWAYHERGQWYPGLNKTGAVCATVELTICLLGNNPLEDRQANNAFIADWWCV